jgi:hypothetical protein
LRFALQAQDRKPIAKAFVAKMKAADKDFVADVEELLRLENEPPKPVSPPPPLPKKGI